MIEVFGRVTQVIGLVIEGLGPASSIGDICEIIPKKGRQRRERSPEPGVDPMAPAASLLAEVVGFKEDRVLLMPLGELRGVGPGDLIKARNQRAGARVGSQLLGRVVDGLGVPLDGKGPIEILDEYPLYAEPNNPLERKRIAEPLDVGIKAINGLLTCGRGQRMGIFAGSGVGKSMLLGMIARYSQVDVNVIALIGERGREVRDFLERDLGEEGQRRSVVVVATSDQSPLVRLRGAYSAMAIAEYFRDQGQEVIFMMDSLTRFAMAQREIGLSVGEPPTSKGFTPSVFALLPKLLERAGTTAGRGSITGFYTVLVEGDDFNEPISDAVRSILDGHIILSRDLAAEGHYPPIDVPKSLSRVMLDLVDPKHRELAQKLRSILATYRQVEDLLNIGAYVAGKNPKTDYAIRMVEAVNDYLMQDINLKVDLPESVKRLESLLR